MTLFSPATEHEVATILQSANGTAFEPTGQNRSAKISAQSVLSAEALSGIVHHDPVDMTITVHAGTRLVEISNHLRRLGQRLTFDLPAAMRPDRSLTAGAAVALNLPSSRRPFAGSVRDAVLGTRFVTGLGEVVATGTRVLKNAAGIDLGRVLCGSNGHLGFLTEVTFRVLPEPVYEQTGIISNVSVRGFAKRVVELMKSGCDISGASYLSAAVARRLDLNNKNCLVIRLVSGFDRRQSDVNMKLEQVLHAAHANALWARIASGHLFAQSAQQSYALITCKASSGSEIGAILEDRGATIALDWRGALVWATLDSDENCAQLKALLHQFPDATLRWQSPMQDSIPCLAPFDVNISRLKSTLDPLKRLKPATSYTYLQI